MLKIFATTVVLLIYSTVFSLPHQDVFGTKKPYNDFTPVVLWGEGIEVHLWDLASQLNVGLSENWERLIHQPQTTGTSAIELVNPQELDQVLNAWGLDQEIRNEAFRDVEMLVRMSADEATYMAQRFNYNSPSCQAGPLPFCLTTLIVVTRAVREFDGSLKAELGHVYIKSAAE
ncbi:hypothetical protein BGX26_003936, partial [Mortierella sp. AD094]